MVSGSILGSPRHFGSHSALEPRIFRGLLGDFHIPPPYLICTWLQKKYLLIQNRGHSEVLEKTPSSAKYVRQVRPPSVPESQPTPPPGQHVLRYVVNDAWLACITFAIWRQFLRKMNAARHNTRTLPLLN